MTVPEPPGGRGAPEEAPREEPELRAIEERLRDERPVPLDSFRVALRDRLLAGLPQARPGVRRLILAYATSGMALLAVAAVGVAGAGPLAV